MNLDTYHDLPGAELVIPGLADLAAGRETVSAMLVASGSSRLRQLGVEVEGLIPESPEDRLYGLLAVELGDAAHSRSNSLIRRLIRFQRALAVRLRQSA